MRGYLRKRRKWRQPIKTTPEPFETSTLTQLLESGDIALDIGANIGHYTIAFAEKVGIEGKVFAFEPDPTNYARLTQTIQARQFTNVTLVKKAISKQSGKTNLYLNPRNFGDHRIYDSQDRRHFIEIETITLNHYFKDFTKTIKLIKMDIQGAEMWALEGMMPLLRKNKGVIIATEFWPWGLKTAGTEPATFVSTLLKLGFRLSVINEGRRALEPVADVRTLLSFCTHCPGGYTNLLALPSNHPPTP